MEENKSTNSRRTFLKTAAIATAGVTIVPRHVLGGSGYIAPSDKLQVASIGVGGMGASDVIQSPCLSQSLSCRKCF